MMEHPGGDTFLPCSRVGSAFPGYMMNVEEYIRAPVRLCPPGDSWSLPVECWGSAKEASHAVLPVGCYTTRGTVVTLFGLITSSGFMPRIDLASLPRLGFIAKVSPLPGLALILTPGF